jgi:3-hydroxyacyl-[acyl-carrier-protein] dehydratase
MSEEGLKLPLEALAIRKILPHRYPFLLIDRVLAMEPGKTIHAVKCLSQNEPFFEGHFPDYPVMPGVLQIEALAQAGAVSVLSMPENAGRIVLLAGAENFRFRRPVVPGDVLDLKVEITRYRPGFGKAHGVASVAGETSAEGDISFALAKG